jgi:hypothetical protein
MGTRNNAIGCAAVSEAHLPFAGITLFRFNGCNLSLPVLESTPGFTDLQVKKTFKV